MSSVILPTTPRCDNCGWTGKATTPARAAHSLRLHSCEKHIARTQAAARGEERRASVDRTPKPCLHKQANHQHGTRACYVLDKCRCTPCGRANREDEVKRVRLHAYGRWDNLVDAQPVRDHIAALRDAGMGWKRVAFLAGVSNGAMTKLIYGMNGKAPSRRVRRETADAILGIQPAPAPGVRVDSTGTKRRLQALVAIGWSIEKLAAASGIDRQRLDGAMRGRQVLLDTKTRVIALYDELWDQRPPEGDHRARIAAERSRNRARANGWLPPAAWDDDTIDDPSSGPPVAPIGERRDRRVHVDDVEFLLRSGESRDSIAARIGVDPSSLMRVLYRDGRADLVKRLSEAS